METARQFLARRDKKKKKKPHKPSAKWKCRDCGKTRPAPYINIVKAAAERCLECGGLVDKIGGRIQLRRTRPSRR